MPTISVRYFASIRERLGRAADELPAEGLASARDVWQRVSSEPPPANLLVAINQEYAVLDAAVRAGDEVAFFPPVTGG
jgi:molybdopterin synthase sulfur carrier subunit